MKGSMRKMSPDNRLGNMAFLDLGEVEDRTQIKALEKLLQKRNSVEIVGLTAGLRKYNETRPFMAWKSSQSEGPFSSKNVFTPPAKDFVWAGCSHLAD
jgi:hypothetical protein